MANSTDPLREHLARLIEDSSGVSAAMADLVAGELLPLFAARERAAAEKAFKRGERAGIDAAIRAQLEGEEAC